MEECKNCNHEHHHEHEEESIKGDVIKLVISFIIFIIAIVKIVPLKYTIYLYVISYIIVGYEVIFKSIKNIFKGEVFDENFLMTIATIGAFAISEPMEAVAVMLFYNLGELFEDIASDRSKKSIIQLMNIKPRIANLKLENEIKEVDPEELKIGDIIVIKPGEKVPVDGAIIVGETLINTSAITGESVPRKVGLNEEIYAGSINESNLIEVKVTKEFKDTEIHKIIELVKNSNKNKSKTEMFITRFAKIYTPVVVILALVLAFVPPLFLGFSSLAKWVRRALVFLVTSCPCALVLSVPLGFFAGIGRAGKEGVLVKGSNYLDILTKTHTMILDKTGTITKGNFEVAKVILSENATDITEDELLKIAGTAEKMSNHPIAKSILNRLSSENISTDGIQEYTEIAGCGIIAICDNYELLVGNEKLMKKENIDYKPCMENGTIVYVAKNKKYLGVIIVRDIVKEDSIIAINEFKQNGIENIYMLTGDNEKTAMEIGKEVGIENVYSNLLPEQKVEKLKDIKGKHGITITIGDGINDSPILALSDLGVSIGNTGSDLAIETSDIVIMDGKLSSFNKLIKTAKRTKGIVKQNIYFAIGIKVIVLVLGAIGISTMWEAVFADVGVTVLTVLNSLRIFNGIKCK